jgi:hypothetical protein
MSDFMDLGPGERIYASGHVQEFSWTDYNAKRIVKKEKLPATDELHIAPRVLRPAGRKKLNAAGIALRDAKAEKRKERKEEDRLLRELERSRKALAKTERRLTQQAEAQAKASRLEEVQRMFNNNAIKPQAIASENSLPGYTRAAVPSLSGKTAYSITGHNRVIYVDNNADVAEAITRYKFKHRLI